MNSFKQLTESVYSISGFLNKSLSLYKRTTPEECLTRVAEAKKFLGAVNSYINFLRTFESEIKIRKRYSSNMQRKLTAVSNKLISAIYSFEKTIALKDRRVIRDLFRRSLGSHVFKSRIINRFYKKPRGYPGDYLMFEMFYDNCPISPGIGMYFDNYVLQHILARAVCSRKEFIKELLVTLINGDGSRVNRILNIGSGSCREIRELLHMVSFSRPIQLSLWDQEQASFDFVRREIGLSGSNLSVEFNAKNILELIGVRTKKEEVEARKFDVIYSLGVVDYFQDAVLERFIESFYEVLPHGGKFIFACCSSKNLEAYVPLRWFCEWDLQARSVEGLEAMLKYLKIKRYEVAWEATGNIFFVIIKK